ncbi:unnamed protein product [Prunus armeniaca]
MTGREGYTQKTVCYKTLSQLLVLKNQDHFSSCCPRWKAISSVSEYWRSGKKKAFYTQMELDEVKTARDHI